MLEVPKTKVGTAESAADVFLSLLRAADEVEQDKEHVWAMGLDNAHRIKYVELGDQDEIVALFELARALPHMIHFGYTARQDLRYAGRPANLRINGSGWARGKMNEYCVVQKPTGTNPVCPGNCRTCDLCKIERGIVIESVLRRPGRQKVRSS